MTVNKAHTIRTYDSVLLGSGAHDDASGALCIMEAEAYFAGEEHTDMPKCVSPVVTRYCQVLNDSGGSEVRERLRSYLGKLAGTVSPELDLQRAFIAADYAVRVFAGIDVPKIVDAATARVGASAAATAANAVFTSAHASASAATAARAADAADAAAVANSDANAAAAACASASAATRATRAARAADAASGNFWDPAFKCLDAIMWPAAGATAQKGS